MQQSSKPRFLVTCVLTAVVAPFLGACGQSADSVGGNDPIGTVKDDLFVRSTAIWTQPSIPVCWETSGFASEKAIARDEVEGSWGSETGASFSGWGACTGGTGPIRIAIADATPNTPFLGSNIITADPGMTLNFTFAKWPCSYSEGICIDGTAGHEFGHALGFAHEQDRSDTPASCNQTSPKDPSQDQYGDTNYESWDQRSIMNYCNPLWNNFGRLSPTDIAGASQFYGGPRSISAIPWSGGQLAFYRGTDGALYQQLAYDAGGGILWDRGGYLTSDVAVVSMSTNRWDAFARGGEGDLWHIAGSGVTAGNWEDLGINFQGSPSVISRGNGSMDVVVRGNDNAVWHRAYVPTKGTGSWRAWESLGGNIQGTPVLASWAPNRLDVFARSYDGSLAHQWAVGPQSNPTWGTFESLGGLLYGIPAAMRFVNPAGVAGVVVYVRGTDQGLYQQYYDGIWHGWQGPLVANIAGNPTVQWDGAETVVGYRNANGTLGLFWWAPGQWIASESVSGFTFGASPTMTLTGQSIGIFARGTDNALWRIAGTGTTSPGSWSQWMSFGGSFK